MKCLLVGLLAVASFSAFAMRVNLEEKEYLGHYRKDPKQPCLVSIYAPYGKKELRIHQMGDTYSDHFAVEVKEFKRVTKDTYVAEDPDFGELLVFSFKINSKKQLTEASVFNRAIRSNTIECIQLKPKRASKQAN